MKIDEVMIGDWVFYPLLSIYLKIAQIKGNTIISELAECSPGMMYDVTPHVRDIEPIPLTQEILEKNGIRYQWGPLWYQTRDVGDKGFMVFFGTERIDIDRNQLYLEYVHELQHALKLCKIDKKIEL